MKDENLFFKNDFGVDTGAIYSFVPEDWLEKIKVEPISTRNLILADGRTINCLLGFSNFTIEG